MTEVKKRKQGFASMDPERQREIAAMGGRAAHYKGVAHEFHPEEARKAGRKGGIATAAKRKLLPSAGAGLTECDMHDDESY